MTITAAELPPSDNFPRGVVRIVRHAGPEIQAWRYGKSVWWEECEPFNQWCFLPHESLFVRQDPESVSEWGDDIITRLTVLNEGKDSILAEGWCNGHHVARGEDTVSPGAFSQLRLYHTDIQGDLYRNVDFIRITLTHPQVAPLIPHVDLNVLKEEIPR